MAHQLKLPREESKNNRIYNQATRQPIKEKSFLLEAGQGKNVNGNVFALLDYIRHDSRFDDYEIRLALLGEKKEEWELKAQKYGIENIIITEFGSPDYLRALGISKYLITDNSFPAYFYKKPEQVYLNTWHGTPIKALGRRDIANAISLANVQANMAKADYLLYPNRFTKDIMMSDYMIERVFKHKTVIIDYPRNDALYRKRFADEIRERYGLEGKRAIAYMPTWRGAGRDIDAKEQVEREEAVIRDIAGALSEDEVLFVNLHFLIGNQIDFSKFTNVYGFPAEYETYDFLAVCDTLITDYSSVAIDFAGTGKVIILYIYDYEQYRQDKKFYIEPSELPFPKAYTLEELRDRLDEKGTPYDLGEMFRSRAQGCAAEKVIALICSGHEAGLEIEDYAERGEYADIAYFENINREESRELIEELMVKKQSAAATAAASAQALSSAEPSLIMFQNALRPETIEYLKEIGEKVDYIRISGHLYCSNFELKLLRLFRKFGIFRRAADKIYRREGMRQIGQFGFAEFKTVQCGNRDRLEIISRLKD